MKKEHYILLGGGALVLLLLWRKKASAPCPLSTVLRWQPLAAELSQENYNVFNADITANILAVIQDQSQGDPQQVYFVGGTWPRYGLCGVPLIWAQAFNPALQPKDLLDPKTNIDLAIKIIAYLDAQIVRVYRAGGVSGPFAPGLSSNAYSGYYHRDTLVIPTATDPAIHQRDTKQRYEEYLACYRQQIGY